MDKFKIENTKVPKVWLGTSLFAGAGELGEKAQEYRSRFYDNPETMIEVMQKAAGLGWGVELLAKERIVLAVDEVRRENPEVALACTCGIEDFVTEVNSALKRKPQLVFLHPRITDNSSRKDIELYFRRVVEEWVLPAAATLDPLTALEKLEDTPCRALLVPAGERGASLEYSVETVHKADMRYFAEIQPAGSIKETATDVLAVVRAGADALVIGVTSADEPGVYMKALQRMGFLK